MAEKVTPSPVVKSVLSGSFNPSQSGEASGSGLNVPSPLPATPIGFITPNEKIPKLAFEETATSPDQSEEHVSKESHLKRLKELRKLLDYIDETTWQYDPIEKFIGHC